MECVGKGNGVICGGVPSRRPNSAICGHLSIASRPHTLRTLSATFGVFLSSLSRPRVLWVMTDRVVSQTENTRGVVKPEEVKFRIVKASGRSLKDTLFHMEIRTLRPGQVRALGSPS